MSEHRAAIMRNRFIREILLDTLRVAYGQGSHFGLTLDHIMRGMRGNRLDATPDELRSGLCYLVDSKLASCEHDETLDANAYRLTAAGQDFCLAEMPWDKVDLYTGKLR